MSRKAILGSELRVGDVIFVKWGSHGAQGDTIIKIEPYNVHPDDPEWVGVRMAWFDELASRAIIFPNEKFDILPEKNRILKTGESIVKRAFDLDI